MKYISRRVHENFQGIIRIPDLFGLIFEIFDINEIQIGAIKTIDKTTVWSGPSHLITSRLRQNGRSPEQSRTLSPPFSSTSPTHLLRPAVSRRWTGLLFFTLTQRVQRWSQPVTLMPVERETNGRRFDSSDGVFWFQPRRRRNRWLWLPLGEMKTAVVLAS